MRTGDTKAVFEECDHVIEGECHVGGQVHFYLETQSVLAVPKRENGEMEVFAASQSPTNVQVKIEVYFTCSTFSNYCGILRSLVPLFF